MIYCNIVNVKLSNLQLNKLKSGTKILCRTNFKSILKYGW